MKAPLFGRIAVLGTGLIGGSLAAALRKNHVAVHIAAYDSNSNSLDFLKAHEFVHSIYIDVAEAVANADVVVLAVPPESLSSVAASIAQYLKNGCIVTDVTSIKRKAVAAIAGQLPEHVHFVPGHPIAGSEKSGAQNSDAELFMGKRVILTPTETQVLSEAVAQVRTLWESVGAQVEYMPADLHDRIYAYVSHLPQIVAFAAKPGVTAESASEAACYGVLRLSKSNPELWADICFANADFIHEALEEFSMFLSQMSHELVEHADTTMVDNDAEAVAPALLCAVLALCLVATALLVEQRTGAIMANYGGSGFKDMTAAAGKHSDSVLAAISAHPQAVAASMEMTLGRLNAIGAALSTGNRESLLKAFTA